MLCNFYSRPCGRGDRPPRPVQPGRGHFYSRPCGRGDVSARVYSWGNCHFYSRPCGRGDSLTAKRWRGYCLFLLTPLREGRLHCRGRFAALLPDFYSRPCGRGDAPAAEIPRKLLISTHAPAGGATERREADAGLLPFLLTPLREGRPVIARTPPFHQNFYSRPCGRGDGRGHRGDGRGRPISTHAPAGGATDVAAKELGYGAISTHAPAGGATRTAHTAVNGIDISTHAPAGGATVFDEFSVSDDARRFLLTPLREGRHDRALLYEMPKIISTHAPAGGATSSRNPCVCTGLYFYSRPCGRGDRTERSACF